MYGVNSMTAPLKRVALRKPGISLLQADPQSWHYGPSFKPGEVEQNHQSFSELLRQSGIEILWMDGDDMGIADAVFTYDASLMTPAGAVLMSPGKVRRRGEEQLHRRFYGAMNIPVIGEMTGSGHAEAGDTLWLDEQTLVVGRGFRTNNEGILQIKQLLEPMGISVHVFDLPVYLGRQACLHLMSLISLIDARQALVCKPLLPVAMWELLRTRGFALLPVPFDEFEASNTLCNNILATGPGECIMLAGFPKTQNLLETAGVSVRIFDGDALCVGCEGGPTCLTRPILRQE